jgi:hypothetical protein
MQVIGVVQEREFEDLLTRYLNLILQSESSETAGYISYRYAFPRISASCQFSLTRCTSRSSESACHITAHVPSTQLVIHT